MKKQVQTSLAISLIASAPCAFAQSKNFEGNSVSLGYGSIQLKNASESVSEKWNNTGKIEFTHFKSLSDSWLLGFGIGTDIGTMKSSPTGSGSGETLYFFSDGVEVLDVESAYYGYQTGSAREISQKRSLSLSIIPAYAFSKESLGFARLSLHRAKFTTTGSSGRWLSQDELTDAGATAPEGGDGCDAIGDPTLEVCTLTSGSGSGAAGSQYLTGYGFGLGYRHNLDNNIFLQAEYVYVKFKRSSQLDIKPENQGVVLSIGYRF